MAINLGELNDRNKKQQQELYNQHYNNVGGLNLRRKSSIDEERRRREEEERLRKEQEAKAGFFKGGSSNILEGYLNTRFDLASDIGQGFFRTLEGVSDFLQYQASDATKQGSKALESIFGKNAVSDFYSGTSDWLKQNAQFNSTGSLFGTNENAQDTLFGNEWRQNIDQASYLGDMGDSVAEGIGNIGAMAALSAVGGQALGATGIGVTEAGTLTTGGKFALSFGNSYMSAYGNARSEAYNNGASDEDARRYGFVNGLAEGLSEQFFDAMPGISSAGIADKIGIKDFLANKIKSGIGSNTAKVFLKLVGGFEEGAEEMISNALVAVGQDIMHSLDENYTYGMDNLTGNVVEDFKNNFVSEDSLKSFISAGFTSVLLGAGGDILTTAQTNQVINAFAKDNNMSFKEAKALLGGENLNQAQQQVQRETNAGNVEINNNVELEDAAKKRIVNFMKNHQGENIESRIEDLVQEEAKKQGITYNQEQLKQEADKIRTELIDQTNNPERYQTFIQNKNETNNELAESFKKAKVNNTQQAHAMYNFVSKLQENNKNLKYQVVNNEILKEMGQDVEGATINGFNQDGTIYINMDAKNPYQAVAYHEIAHSIKDTSPELYNELKNLVFELKGKEGLEQYRKLYKVNDGELASDLTENVEDEYINDQLGEILNDDKFIQRIENRNILQKIIDEIKRVVKYMTSSKDQKALMKTQQRLEEIYKQGYQEAKFEGINKQKAAQTINENKTPQIKQDENVNQNKSTTNVPILSEKLREYLELKEKYDKGNIKVEDRSKVIEQLNQLEDKLTPEERNEIYKRESQNLNIEQPKYSLSQDSQGKELSDYIEKNNYTFKDNGNLEVSNLTDKQINELVKIYHTTGYDDVDANYLKEMLKRDKPILMREVADRFIEKELGHKPQIDTTKVFEDSEGNSLTQEQVNFFKDSGVRDIRGRLIPVYHRTDADFTIFDSKAGKQHGNKYGKGFYFSITPENYGNNTMKVYLNAKDGEYKYIPKAGYYIVQEPNMIKNVDNTNPTSSPDIRYSLSQDSQGRELSKEQQEYFKDSKVRDNEGRLLEVYHGSNSEFTIFDITKAGESSKEAKVGFWFTPNKKGAENFANEAWYGDKKPTTYKVYLDIKNPKIYETYEVDQQQRDNMLQDMRNLEQEIKDSSHKYAWTETGDYKLTTLYHDLVEMNRRETSGIKSQFKEDVQYNEEFYRKLAAERNISNEKFDEMLQDAKHQVELETQNKKARDDYYTYVYSDGYEQFKTELYLSAGMSAEDANVGGMGMMMKNENEAIANFVEGLKQQGYDGIFIKNTQYDNESLGEGKNNDQYVAFYPEQIKNVDNTSPTSSPDIRYSLSGEAIIENNEDIGGLSLKPSPYQTLRPKVRGGWNIDKIQKQLKGESSNRVNSKDISEFDNLDDVMNNLFYHGSISAHDNLKAGSTLQENQRTGGYGEAYHTISLSGNKNIASNFASMGRSGSVMPVILKKNANVIEMPNIEDSIELEDILPELWDKGIDAVKIGDWDIETKGYGEQEIVILNPRAIMTLPAGTTYFENYHKPKFANMTNEELRSALDKTYQRALQDDKLTPERAEVVKSRYEKILGDSTQLSLSQQEQESTNNLLKVIESYDDYLKTLPSYQRLQERQEGTPLSNYTDESHGILTKEDYKNKKIELFDKQIEKADNKMEEQAKRFARENLELTRKAREQLQTIIDKYKGQSRESIFNSNAKEEIREFVRNNSRQEFVEEIIDEQTRDLQKAIRNTEFVISKDSAGEFADGITQFKKNNPGLKIKYGKQNIDSVYQELQEQFPGMLETDVSDKDIPFILADVLKKSYRQFDNSNVQVFELNDKEIENIANKIYRGLTNNAITDEQLESLTKEISKKVEEKYARAMATEKYREIARNTIDVTDIKDKKRGIQYKINTMKRNLRDIMSKEQAQLWYDTYFKPITIHNAQSEIDKQSYVERIQKYNLNNAESTYTQMLGELKYNPETNLTSDQVNTFAETHNVDKQKCTEAVEEFRNIYDELIGRVNEALKANGYKEIDYRKGYFPHFIEDKPNSIIGKFADKFGWNVQKGTLPTDIAGLTDGFKPGKVWTSFSQQRTGDNTDYNALKGMDNYLRGAMDLIYHTEDIQKLRALENEIRYQYSSDGVKTQIDEIYANQELSAEEKAQQIALLTDNLRDNPLGNLVTELRDYTNGLANKKSILDRGMEQALGRDWYSIMNNINGRVSANMVGANLSSAMTNFIPITQAWSQVSTKNLMRGMYESIKNTLKNDGFDQNSVYLTNRTQQADTLYQTTLDKVNQKLGLLFEGIDSFTSNTIVRAKYYENLDKGMSEQSAIENADEFAKDVMAGRSKGDQPTIFNTKNPLYKMFTAFQLEVNNQYGYMFKDIPADLGDEGKDKLAMAFMKMFIGAWLYNMITEKITGRKAAFSPIDMAADEYKIATSDMDLPTKVQNIAKDVVQETPFLGGIMGGGRLPLQSAIPYENPLDMVTKTFENIGTALGDDESKKKTAINSLKKEWMKPVYFVALPFAGGQIKKSVEGMAMYDENLPVAGSYTDAGKLRFEADTSPQGKIQALLFGQYASENAREYFDKGYTPLTEKQINEALDANLPMTEYREIKKGLSKQEGTENKVDYIYNLPISDEQKNVLVNNTLNRKEDIDLTNYGDYGSLEEFDYATKNPTKYKTITQITDYDTYQTYKEDIAAIKDKYSTTDERKSAVFNYINNLNLNMYQKLMLQKMAAGYSIKTYKRDMQNYIESLQMTAEEKQQIDNELFS